MFTAERPPSPKSDFLLPTCRPRLMLLVLHCCLDSEPSSRQDRACVAASSTPKEAGMPRLQYEPSGRRADALVHSGRSTCSVRHADGGEYLVREEKAAPVTLVLSRVVTVGPRAKPALPQRPITRVSYRAVEMVSCRCHTSSPHVRRGRSGIILLQLLSESETTYSSNDPVQTCCIYATLRNAS